MPAGAFRVVTQISAQDDFQGALTPNYFLKYDGTNFTLAAVNAALDIGDPIGSGTPGSVLFIDASGNLGQDNASFFWDDTNNALKLLGAPPASATVPKLALGSNLVSGDADGTYLGINAPAGYTGHFLNFQLDGARRAHVDQNGMLHLGTQSGFGLSTAPFAMLEIYRDNGVVMQFISGTDTVDYTFGQFDFAIRNPDAATPVRRTWSFGGDGTYSDAGVLSNVTYYLYNNITADYAMVAWGATSQVAYGVADLSFGAPLFDGQMTVYSTAAARPQLVTHAHASQSGNNQEWRNSADVVNAFISPIWAASFRPRDAVTAAVTTALFLGHNTSGTAAAGFGNEIRFLLESSTTENTDAGALVVEWVDATHATRKARATLSVYDTAVREAVRYDTNGTVAYTSMTGAPPASATLSRLGLGSAIVGGDADGTYLGINAPAAYAGDFANFQVDGDAQIRIFGDGQITQYWPTAALDQVFQEFESADPGDNEPWRFQGEVHTNPFGSRNNQIFVMGWGPDADSTIGLSFEQFFSLGASQQYSEFHLVYHSAISGGIRMLTAACEINTDYVRMDSLLDRRDWVDKTGVHHAMQLLMDTTTGSLTFSSSTPLFKSGNDTPFLYGRNAADNANVELLRIDSSNAAVIAISGGPTKIGGSLTMAAAPPASATAASLLLGSALVAGDADGTFIGINATAGYAGDFANYQVNGASFFRVSSAGDLVALGTAGFGAAPPANTQVYMQATTTGAAMRGGYSFVNVTAAGSGIVQGLLGTVGPSFTSGTHSGAIVGLMGEVQATHTGSTVSFAAGTQNSVVNNASGTITSANGGFYEILNLSSGTIDAANGLAVRLRNLSTGTISVGVGLLVNSPANSGGGSLGFNAGIFVNDQTAGGANYALYTNAGLVRFGDQTAVDGSVAGRIQSIVRGAASQSVDIAEWQNSSSVVLASVSNIGAALFRPLDAATNTVTVAQTLGHSTSGTPAAGFGNEQRMTLQSSTTADREAAAWRTTWATATDASRKARQVGVVWDTAEREAIRFEASGSAAMIGFLGASAVARTAAYTPTNVTTDRSYDANATTLDEIADVLGTLIEDLRTFGLLG